MDIAFGDCVYLGGDIYALLLVDADTSYRWFYGMSYLSLDSITSDL